MYRLTLLLLLSLGLAACATQATKLASLQIGMTKAEVLERMGDPTSVAANGGAEYLTYYLCVEGCVGTPLLIRRENFYVKLTNGSVESFGNRGDFGTTATPTVKVQQETTVTTSGNPKADAYLELRKLKDLLDSGVLTQAEFDIQKRKILAN